MVESMGSKDTSNKLHEINKQCSKVIEYSAAASNLDNTGDESTEEMPSLPSKTSCCKSEQCNLDAKLFDVYRKQTEEYIRSLENDHQELQEAFLSLTSHFARMQFHLRQLIQAEPEVRDNMLREVARIAFKDIKKKDEKQNNKGLSIKSNDLSLNDIRINQHQMINHLRTLVTRLYPSNSMAVRNTRQSSKRCNKDLSSVYPTTKLESSDHKASANNL